MYDEFFSKAHELIEDGVPFATATVVRAERPTSGKPGDKAIVTSDGVMYGWIGGSCAQPAVIEEAKAAIADNEGRLVRITPEPGKPPEGVKEVAMTCFSGGTLDIYVEPQQPKPRLVIVGHLPTASALAHLGKAMSYRTIAVDPETGGESMQHADEVLTDLDSFAERVNPLTYVIVASHGHFDEPALEVALKTRAPYVGLVASRKRAESVLEHLRRKGLADDDLARLKAPAGLDIGARRGDEIALSILAQIVELRRAGERLEWTEADSSEAEAREEPAATAIDPVCGMTVEIPGASHVFEHRDEAFYFCCAGCREKFATEPSRYVPSANVAHQS